MMMMSSTLLNTEGSMVSDERTAVMEREASSVQRLSISWDRKADEEKSSRMFSVSVGKSCVNF